MSLRGPKGRGNLLCHKQKPSFCLNLALNWLCFFADPNHNILHNHLSYMTLRQFNPTTYWLCFFKFINRRLTQIYADICCLSFPRRRESTRCPQHSERSTIKLGLFSPSVQSNIFLVSPCYNWLCVHFSLSKIGFVFSKYDIPHTTYHIHNTK